MSKKIEFLEVNENNLYLLHEAVECLLHTIEILKGEHNQDIQDRVNKSIETAQSALAAVRKPKLT